MKILTIVDQYGWSYDSLARGYQTYSKNEILIKKLSDVTTEDMQSSDIIFVFGWINLITLQENKMFRRIMKAKNVVAGSWSAILPTEESYIKYTGRKHAPNLSIIDTFIVSDRKVLNKMLTNNPTGANVFFADQPVDTELFRPDAKPHDGFKVGWCGNPTRPDKRVHLLKQLKYPVDIRTLWGAKHFVKNRSMTDLADWYNGLDVYISLSNATVEGGTSLTVVEAMACGLPVISTAHGSEIVKLLSSMMIVPCSPEEETVKKTNEILEVLAKDSELCKSIGEANRKHVEEYYSWKGTTKHYDEIFGQFGFRYVRFKTISEEKKKAFLKRIQEHFIKYKDDDTLYLNGDWRVCNNGNICFPDVERYGYVCLNRNGDMVGYWTISWLPTNHGYGNKTVYPSTIVEVDYRGMGIGKQLFTMVIHLAKQMGATKYFAANRYTADREPLNVTPRIYAKHGFKLVNTYEIVSDPRGQQLKYKKEWDKRPCVQYVFIKELTED